MNVLYPSFKDLCVNKQFDWVADNTKIALYTVATVYVPSHSVITDLGGIQVAPGDDPITIRATNQGFCQGFPVEYNSLLNPEVVAVAVIYREFDGALVAFLDNVNGFTFQPSGANYTLSPGGPSGAYFAL